MLSSFSKMDYVTAIRIFNSRKYINSHKNENNPDIEKFLIIIFLL